MRKKDPEPLIDVQRTVAEKYMLVVEERHLLEWLRRRYNIPAGTNVSITLTVPTGGDYSGTTLDLKDFELKGLKVEWTVTNIE